MSSDFFYLDLSFSQDNSFTKLHIPTHLHIQACDWTLSPNPKNVVFMASTSQSPIKTQLKTLSSKESSLLTPINWNDFFAPVSPIKFQQYLIA